MTAGGGGAGDSISHLAETTETAGRRVVGGGGVGGGARCGRGGQPGCAGGAPAGSGKASPAADRLCGVEYLTPPCWVSAFSPVWWRQRLQDEKSLGLLVELKDSCSLARF